MVSRPLRLAILFALLASCAAASQGIKGRASLEGTLVDVVQVRVYALRPGGFGPLTGDEPVASALSGSDGQYAIELPAGRYVVEALKKAPGSQGSAALPGDLYCLYSGSPVTVTDGQWTTTGLYMTTVPVERRTKGTPAKVTGKITFKGQPLEKTYLYAFSSVDSQFRGPPDFLQPVAKGTFTLELPPGTWYLLARKRMKGGAYGPIELGDKLNFYPGNPLKVVEGESIALEIPLAERLAWLEEETKSRGVLVRLLRKGTDAPLPGYRVLMYRNPDRSGPPLQASERTDEKGEVTIVPPPSGVFLRARKNLGGPLEENECHADADLDPEAVSAQSKLLVLRCD